MKFWMIASFMIIGCAPAGLQPTFVAPPTSRQVVIVTPSGRIPNATLTAWVRRGDFWMQAVGPFPCVVGARGVAPIGAKREGDKRTPAGIFPLGPAFGYEAVADTRLQYCQATADDYWIDDPASRDYNRWVRGPKPGCSHEVLRRNDEQYRLVAVIGYNVEPVVPGRGSAIFMHIWKLPGHGTDGCVALDARHLKALLKWLDQKQEPRIIVQGPTSISD